MKPFLNKKFSNRRPDFEPDRNNEELARAGQTTARDVGGRDGILQCTEHFLHRWDGRGQAFICFVLFYQLLVVYRSLVARETPEWANGYRSDHLHPIYCREKMWR